MKLWVDDVRPAPEGYVWLKSVNDAKMHIESIEEVPCNKTRIYTVYFPYPLETDRTQIELIDIDHDAGEYVSNGGDYIKLLDWLEETGRNYPIRIHSMNPVGVENMRRIIQRNGWTEVQ